MPNALLPVTPDKAILAINLAFQKMAQAEAEAEMAYLASATAIAKNIESLSGAQTDGEFFLCLVQTLKGMANDILLGIAERAAEKEGLPLHRDFKVTLAPNIKLRLISHVTDLVMASTKATLEGNDPAAARALIAGNLYAKVFAPASDAPDVLA